jgi:hypothetical protein
MNLTTLTYSFESDGATPESIGNSMYDSGKSNSPSTIWLVPFLFLCLSAWAMFIPATLPRAYIFTWDSAAYVETARSLHAGRGLQQRVIHGLGQDYWEPIAWWPPGYPILIALVQTTGLSPESAGVAIAIISAALAVMILAYICLRLMHWSLAIPVTLTTVIMPIFLHISVACMSDATYFALLMGSMACLICWSMRPGASWQLMAAAGFLAGAGWVVRNVGIALFIATAIFLLAHLLWMRFRDVFKMGAIWLAGMAVCGVPLIIRNLVTFGGVNSYQMPRSDLSLMTNVNKAGEVIVDDLTTSARIADLVISKYGMVVIALLAVAAVLLWGRKLINSQLGVLLQKHKLTLLMVSYAVIHISIVIAARTKYRWGEPVTSRHAAPTYWVIWICLAIYGPVLLRRIGLTANMARAATIAVLIIAGALQVKANLDLFNRPAAQVTSIQTEIGNEAAGFLAKDIAKDQIVLSMRADLLRVHCDVHARKIPPIAQYDYVQPLNIEELRWLGESGFLWGLVIEDVKEAKKGTFDFLIKDIVENPGNYPELERININSPALILRFVRSTDLYTDENNETQTPKSEGLRPWDYKHWTESVTSQLQVQAVLKP